MHLCSLYVVRKQLRIKTSTTVPAGGTHGLRSHFTLILYAGNCALQLVVHHGTLRNSVAFGLKIKFKKSWKEIITFYLNYTCQCHKYLIFKYTNTSALHSILGIIYDDTFDKKWASLKVI